MHNVHKRYSDKKLVIKTNDMLLHRKKQALTKKEKKRDAKNVYRLIRAHGERRKKLRILDN